jgi:hypothetical protein
MIRIRTIGLHPYKFFRKITYPIFLLLAPGFCLLASFYYKYDFNNNRRVSCSSIDSIPRLPGKHLFAQVGEINFSIIQSPA